MEKQNKDTQVGPGRCRRISSARSRSERSDSGRGGRSGNEPRVRLRRRDQIATEFGLVSVSRVDGTDGLKDDSVRRRTAVAVVGLTGVRAQVAERDAPDEERIVAELLVALRGERKHPLASPPRDGRPWPADGVAVDDARIAQHHHRQTLIGNDVRSARSGRIFFWFCFWLVL